MNDYTVTVPKEDLVLAVEALKGYQNELTRKAENAEVCGSHLYSQVCLDEVDRLNNIIQQVEDLL